MEKLKTVVTYLSILIGLYLLGALFAWTFNPAEWNALGRGVLGFFMVLVLICGIFDLRVDIDMDNTEDSEW